MGIKQKKLAAFYFQPYFKIFILAFIFSSCATSPMIQPQINSLVVAEQFDYALKLLENNEQSYGSNNRLLYLLDYGLVLHYAGRYQESIMVFEQAKMEFDKMITVSLSRQAGTWLMNDNTAPYRGEDFERVMINVFQALNFAALNKFEEALVEARNADSKLSLFNRQYERDQKNVYKEDAFARLLMGIMYEAVGTRADLNDAHISYAKAVKIYEEDYELFYGIPTPRILKENILATAKFMGSEEYDYFGKKFEGTPFVSLSEKQHKAELYLIQYHGYSPVKHQTAIPIPLPGGYLTKFTFPKYEVRKNPHVEGVFKAVGQNEVSIDFDLEKGEDLSAIAIQNLDNRKVRVIAKAALRAFGKYSVERIQENHIEGKYGKDTAKWFRYVSSLYNIHSEQADLRSWQTLPAGIRLSRIIVDPGEYGIFFNENLLEHVRCKPGEKRFIVVRTAH